MTVTNSVLPTVPVLHPNQFYIDGQWVSPTSDARIDVIDSTSEEVYFSVAEAQKPDMDRAISAARRAFDDGPWPTLSHAERATYLRAIGAAITARVPAIGEIWPRQSGILHTVAMAYGGADAKAFEYYADLATTFPFEELKTPQAGGEFGLLVREPVGVVGAIIPWNGPFTLLTAKVAPALLAGCTVIIKASPEAPGEAYLFAEIAEEVGLPPGVVNVVTADREVSELLVTDPRVDKIAFTGSTAAGRRIASLLGQRIGRFTLELGGKSAAVILEDADIARAAATLGQAECLLTGQVCSSLTRLVVVRKRYDELVDGLASTFASVQVGDPFDSSTQMGPLAMKRQLDRVESMISRGVEGGARLVTGGGRPKHLDRGYFIEPTLFADVDNASAIAQEEIFGPVLCVIPADDEDDAVRIANDTIYGLNASVFTEDVDRARRVARRLRSGTVGHNAPRGDMSIAFGGFKQSGIGREGSTEGLLPYLEVKAVILDDVPTQYRDAPAAPKAN